MKKKREFTLISLIKWFHADLADKGFMLMSQIKGVHADIADKQKF